jgi:hypothetical protein
LKKTEGKMSNKPEGGEQMAVLWYDISGKGSPVNELRRCCVYVNRSVAICPLGEVPRVQGIMQPFVEEGADVDISAFVPEETDKLRRRALAALNKHARRILKVLRGSLAKADTELAEAERLQSAKEVKRWRQRASLSFTIAKRDIAAAEECALVFQLTGDLNELLTAVRKEIHARHGEFFNTIPEGERIPWTPALVDENTSSDPRNLTESAEALARLPVVS